MTKSATSNTKTKKPRLSLIDSAAFASTKYAHEWFVSGVLAAKQPCVIGGPLKTLKTSLAIDLAVSLGTGTPFLNKFSVPKPKRVAVFSGESGSATLQETAQRICLAKGKKFGADCDVRWCFKLPRMGSQSDRNELRDILKAEQIDVAVIDPLYLCLISGGDTISASNLFEVGAALLKVSETCDRAGATLVLVHHTTKMASSRKEGTASNLHDLAFAGIGEFARQWLMLKRVAEYQPGTGLHELNLSIGGSAGHSSQWTLRVDEGVTTGTSGKRKWSVRVAPNHVASPKSRSSGILALADN